MSSCHQIEDHTLMDFANSVVSHDAYSVMSLMAHLHSMAAPEASLQTLSLDEAMVYQYCFFYFISNLKNFM